MKFERKLRMCFFSFFVLGLMHGQAQSNAFTEKCNAAIEPYVNFLKKTKTSPVDYVMDLFNRFDIVILCERAHPEITQYDFIWQLVKDERFIHNVGHIFTEVGTSVLNEDIDAFLKNEDLSEKEARSRLRVIYRNMAFHPVWNNLNFYDFLRRLRLLNLSLTGEKKINLYFSDMPFNWAGMTKEKYENFQKTLPRRDRLMADQIIDKLSEILQSSQARKKALVIMNFRHAFNDRFELPKGKKPGNVGRYIFEKFPGKTANVMLNSVRIMLGTTDNDVIMAPIQDGKWDAAFDVMSNPDVGFNFNPSPFGQDEFDYFPARKEGLTYQDIFTGFIFYRPLKMHKFSFGVPRLFEDGFDHTAINRFILTGASTEEAERYVKENRKLNESQYDDLEKFDKEIQKWISPTPLIEHN